MSDKTTNILMTLLKIGRRNYKLHISVESIILSRLRDTLSPLLYHISFKENGF